ncbi:MAG: FAD-dependent oxidoreductase [Chloroflexi bacterium]|nr:MAG: FAD-dependent oxidoreductase [Chloroflexota bacterium]TMG40195.1 MAG: FAD-dependent oxidoreductase [Chloroflexota bacterium]
MTLGADLVVIGAGSAGNAAFLAARRRGAKRVLVAERSTIGGDCYNEAFAQSAARLP